jgi:hypothetical protein
MAQAMKPTRRAVPGACSFEAFSFGSIRIDGVTYEHDVLIDRGEVRKRKKRPSKKFREKFGHTPVSTEEKIPWKCKRLVIGTGTGALPVMDQVREEAKCRHVDLVMLPTAEGDRGAKHKPAGHERDPAPYVYALARNARGHCRRTVMNRRCATKLAVGIWLASSLPRALEGRAFLSYQAKNHSVRTPPCAASSCSRSTSSRNAARLRCWISTTRPRSGLWQSPFTIHNATIGVSSCCRLR